MTGKDKMWGVFCEFQVWSLSYFCGYSDHAAYNIWYSLPCNIKAVLYPVYNLYNQYCNMTLPVRESLSYVVKGHHSKVPILF